MARTMTDDKLMYRAPLGWLAVIAVAAAVVVAGFALSSKAPSSGVPAETYMIDGNFAP